VTFESHLESLADPDKRLTSAQLMALSNLDKPEALELREVWPEIHPERRARIVAQMIDLAQDNVDLNYDAVYRIALDDEEGVLRVAAIQGLHEYEGRDLIRPLTVLLEEDPEVDVRGEAAVALGRYALAAELGQYGESDTQTIREALLRSAEDTDEDEVVRAKSIEALGAMSDEEIENLIESIYEEDSLHLKIGAVDAMGRSCNEIWLPTIYKEIEHRAPLMRHAAAFALGQIGEESSIPYLQRAAIMDPDREVRLAAVAALGEIGGKKASVALKSVLFEGHDDLREAVEEAMQEIAFNDDPLRPI